MYIHILCTRKKIPKMPLHSLGGPFFNSPYLPFSLPFRVFIWCHALPMKTDLLSSDISMWTPRWSTSSLAYLFSRPSNPWLNLTPSFSTRADLMGHPGGMWWKRLWSIQEIKMNWMFFFGVFNLFHNSPLPSFYIVIPMPTFNLTVETCIYGRVTSSYWE